MGSALDTLSANGCLLATCTVACNLRGIYWIMYVCHAVEFVWAVWHLVYPWHGLGSCIVTKLVSFYGPSGTLSESELVLANALHVRQANGLSAKPSDSLRQKHWISWHQ